MKQITSVLLLLAVLAATSLVSSCDEPDGRWDKMKWIDHSGLNQENGTYLVPADGGEYTFECKNYKAPWLSSIGVNGEYVYPNLASMDEFHSFTGEWFSVKCDGADVVISIDPLDESTATRNLSLTVTAGDIFDSFSFTQQR